MPFCATAINSCIWLLHRNIIEAREKREKIVLYSSFRVACVRHIIIELYSMDFSYTGKHRNGIEFMEFILPFIKIELYRFTKLNNNSPKKYVDNGRWCCWCQPKILNEIEEKRAVTLAKKITLSFIQLTIQLTIMKSHELANWSIYTRKKGHTKNSILLENEQRPIFPGANAKMRQQIKNCSLDDRIKGATRKKKQRTRTIAVTLIPWSSSCTSNKKLYRVTHQCLPMKRNEWIEHSRQNWLCPSNTFIHTNRHTHTQCTFASFKHFIASRLFYN